MSLDKAARNGRHEAEFSVVPDAPLTPLGKKQAATLAPQIKELAKEVDLVVSSPLKRTLQTTKLGWAPALERLGIENIICLPQAQECNARTP